MSDPVSQAGAGKDERVFFTAVGIGLCIVAVVTIFAFKRMNPALLATQTTPASQLSGALIQPASAKTLRDFQLTERSGQSVSRADLDGKFVVVNFVHTSCSVTCLEVNYRMAELQKSLEKVPDVRLLSLTVDPQSDTPEALRKFASRFEADASRWLFLTGETPAVYSLIENSFLGKPDPRLIGFVPGGWASSETIALVDKQGRVRAAFNGLKKDSARQILETIQKLRLEPVS
jgi:cytochrome oxidase Cu insertion factor (SCO1/SenC/PrrC family)